MGRCRNCKVEILDDAQICPLCQSVLEEGEVTENSYPDARIRSRKMKLLMNILLFMGIFVIAMTVYVNVVRYTGTLWSLIVAGGIAFFYLFFRIVVVGNGEYISKLYGILIIGILYTIMIDLVIGYTGWSTNYVLPAGIIVAAVGTIIIMLIDIINWQSYLICQLFLVLCSGVGLILRGVHVVTDSRVGQVAFGMTLFLFLGTFIIGDRKARVELSRRFHIR